MSYNHKSFTMKRIIIVFFLLTLTELTNGQTWQPLGGVDSFQISSCLSMAIDNMDAPFIAFADGDNSDRVSIIFSNN